MAGGDSNLDVRPGDIAILQALPRQLLRAGYVDAFLVHGTLQARLSKLRESQASVPGSIRTLIALFALGQRVLVSEAEQVLTEVTFQALERLGVILREGDTVHASELCLIPALEHFSFVPAPGGYPLRHFGDETSALATRIQPRQGERCLNLCAGPGIQAVRCAAAGGTVVAIESDEIAVACAELNAVMNGVDSRIEIRAGDLYKPLAPGERFDFVCAEPPMLPLPPRLVNPAAEEADAQSVVEKVLFGLPGVLAEQATAQVIGVGLGGGHGPYLRKAAEALALEHELRFQFTVPSRSPLQLGAPVFEALAHQCSHAARIHREEMRSRLAAHFQALNASYLYPFFCTVSRGAEKPGVSVTTHYERPGGFWFR